MRWPLPARTTTTCRCTSNRRCPLSVGGVSEAVPYLAAVANLAVLAIIASTLRSLGRIHDHLNTPLVAEPVAETPQLEYRLSALHQAVDTPIVLRLDDLEVPATPATRPVARRHHHH